jgi:hypothetical protein
MDVPCKLFGDHAHDRALAFRRKCVDSGAPHGNQKERQQHDFGDEHAPFDPRGPAAADPVMARHGMRRAAEADQHVSEEQAPADEQHQHQPVHQHHDLVDVAGVGGAGGRQSKPPEHLRLDLCMAYKMRRLAGAPGQ